MRSHTEAITGVTISSITWNNQHSEQPFCCKQANAGCNIRLIRHFIGWNHYAILLRMRMWKEVNAKHFKTLSQYCLEGLRKTTYNLTQDGHSKT
jgi:hypothetical protein